MQSNFGSILILATSGVAARFRSTQSRHAYIFAQLSSVRSVTPVELQPIISSTRGALQ